MLLSGGLNPPLIFEVYPMLKYLVLLLATFSAYAEYTPNMYRKINVFADDHGSSFVVIRSDAQKELYSAVPIVLKGKDIQTTILSDTEFSNLKTEFGIGEK